MANKNTNNTKNYKDLEIDFDQIEKRWSDVFDNVDLIVVALDQNGTILYNNNYLSELTRYDKSELFGRNWFDQLIPPEENELKQFFEDNVRKGRFFPHHENPILTKDAKKRIIAWSNTVFYDSHRETFGIIGFGQDVTDQRSAETALKEVKGRYDLLFGTMTSGVLYQDATGRIITVNPAAEKILGMSVKRIVGKKSIDSILEMSYEDGSICPAEECPSEIALKTGHRIIRVVRGIKTPGRPKLFWVRASAVPETKKEEKFPCHVYMIFDDITEEKENAAAEKRHLEELEKMNKLMIDREMKMIDLKKELEKLKAQSGKG